MLTQFYILFAIVHVISGQINGEFWWLNNKLAAIRNVEPAPPKIDDTNENETDESIKIVFKDEDNASKNRTKSDKLIEEKETTPFVFRENSKATKPVDVKSDIKVNNQIFFGQNAPEYFPMDKTIAASPAKESEEKLEDIFQFVFPESEEIDNKIATVASLALNKSEETFRSTPTVMKPNKIAINDKIWFEDDTRPDKNNFQETESICTFMKKQECTQNKGVIHKSNENFRNCPKLRSIDGQKVCCILPHKTEVSSPIRYPEPIEEYLYRNKRSAPTESSALKQRNALLQRKFVTVSVVKPSAPTTKAKVTQKIVTPDDYVDPYWNVKNVKGPSQANTKYDYVSQEYGDYTVELPKPGLIGLYSDSGSSQTTWQLSNKNKGFVYGGSDYMSQEDVSEEIPFGYSSFDPRKHNKRISAMSPKKPVKIKIPDEETTEPSRPISFKSNPDFHLLEEFKLLNLAKTKNRFVRTTVPLTVTESHRAEFNTQPCQLNSFDYEDSSEEQQVYRKCGKTLKKYTGNVDTAEEGFDPWLALVIRTRSRQKIQCYATILHPRAAITAADCVVGSKPGEISLLSGVWDLNSQASSQQRLCAVHAHPEYNRELENNVALLSWKRPLNLDVSVQPACVADPHVGDLCYFVGWGGYDQAIQPTARRQRATILSPRQCAERISKPDVTLPQDAFCAAVKLRGTVTGVGGPLLCRRGNRAAVVGLAVWREDVVVLLPVLQWVTTTLPDIVHD